ncbi:MAG: peptidylprolyl isomerase, partial [Planctomycetota bacterium]|nr:peptidylprolyl isomerase [Planctomycetota bacterium]
MANRTGRSARLSVAASAAVAWLEPLETRLLLAANTAPVFSTALWDTYFLSEAKDSGGNYVLDGGLHTFTADTIGIDGNDVNGDALTITAVSDNPNVTAYIPTGNRYARLHFVASNGTTVMGDVVVQLFDADGRAPLAASRFVTLATKHVNADGTTVDPTSPLTAFYTSVKVHRVIPGFMMQTGDAANGDGTGGSPLGAFNDPNPWPNLSFTGPGVLAMANSGPNTNDCQFFITDGSYAFGNNSYVIFGQVISGQSVVKSITNLARDSNDRPNSPPILQNVQVFTSTQDATVTFTAAAGFTGVAHVTIKLDDGHGGVTQKVIAVRPLADLGPNLPTITTDAVTTMTAGVAKVITPVYADDGILPLTYTATADNSLMTASVDPATGQVTLNAPATFSGIVQYTITAIEAVGSFDRTPTSFTGTVFVHSPTEVAFYSNTLSTYTGTSKNAVGGFGVGNTYYVVNGSKGLARYDLTDPANPVKLAELTTDFSNARQVQVVGTTAFVADGSNGFKAFDVSNPAAFTLLGAKVATGGSALAFALAGTTAWIADGTNGVTAIDVANPAAMTKVGSFKTWGSFTAGYVVGVAVRGNTLYFTDNFGYVVILDIS